MPPGGKVEFSGALAVNLKFAGEMKAKVEMERLGDGTYTVTVRGGLGLGLVHSSKEGPSLDAAAMMGGQGGVVLHFDTAAEAADRLAALSQTGALKAVNVRASLVE